MCLKILSESPGNGVTLSKSTETIVSLSKCQCPTKFYSFLPSAMRS
ncbi:hypothetical protein VPHD273_0071 [Vibrio phage D273]